MYLITYRDTISVYIRLWHNDKIVTAVKYEDSEEGLDHLRSIELEEALINKPIDETIEYLKEYLRVRSDNPDCLSLNLTIEEI